MRGFCSLLNNRGQCCTTQANQIPFMFEGILIPVYAIYIFLNVFLNSQIHYFLYLIRNKQISSCLYKWRSDAFRDTSLQFHPPSPFSDCVAPELCSPTANVSSCSLWQPLSLWHLRCHSQGRAFSCNTASSTCQIVSCGCWNWQPWNADESIGMSFCDLFSA